MFRVVGFRVWGVSVGPGVFFFLCVWLGSVFFFVWLGSAWLGSGPVFFFFFFRFFPLCLAWLGFFLRLAWLGLAWLGARVFFFSVSGLARLFASSGLARLGLARGPFFFFFLCVWLGSVFFFVWLGSAWLGSGPVFVFFFSLCLAWLGFLLRLAWLGLAWLGARFFFFFSVSGLARFFSSSGLARLGLARGPFFLLCGLASSFFVSLRLAWLGSGPVCFMFFVSGLLGSAWRGLFSLYNTQKIMKYYNIL